MLTLKVNARIVTWPDDFAHMMMKQYRTHGVLYQVCNDPEIRQPYQSAANRVPSFLHQIAQNLLVSLNAVFAEAAPVRLRPPDARPLIMDGSGLLPAVQCQQLDERPGAEPPR